MVQPNMRLWLLLFHGGCALCDSSMLMLNPVAWEVPRVWVVGAIRAAQNHCPHLAVGIPGLQLLLQPTVLITP